VLKRASPFTLAAKVGKTASQPRVAIALAAAQKNLQRAGPYSSVGVLRTGPVFWQAFARFLFC